MVAQFDALLKGFQELLKSTEYVQARPLSVAEADKFLTAFRKKWNQYSDDNKAAPPFINIWKISGLDRNEIRNCKVLAWLLDPEESHFQRTRFLRCLLEEMQVPHAISDIGKPRVRREVCEPEGNCRLDITVECETFLLCIEAKIGAPEDPKQLTREFEAVHTSGILEGRRFVGKYLTRNGTSGEAVAEGFTRVLWRDVASALGRFAGASGVKDDLVARSEFVRDIAWHYAQFIMGEIYGEAAFPVYRR